MKDTRWCVSMSESKVMVMVHGCLELAKFADFKDCTYAGTVLLWVGVEDHVNVCM